MSTFFATIFPSRALAEQGQRIVEAYAGRHELKLASSVVVARNPEGGFDQYGGSTPGALGATMLAVVGGVLGLAGGPTALALGTLAGGLSGGWFDILRVEDRETFMNSVAGKLKDSEAALLGEVVRPTDDVRRAVETDLVRIGGILVE